MNPPSPLDTQNATPAVTPPEAVPPDVLSGTELGKKQHAARAAKLSIRTIENLGNRKAIPVVRISARCVRYHIPSVLAALRRFEVKAISIASTRPVVVKD